MQGKIYCGVKSVLPANQQYTRFGTRNECLKCGFGSAMYKYRWAEADPTPRPPNRENPGCMRITVHPNGIVRGNQFVEQNDMSPKMASASSKTKVLVLLTTLIAIITFVLMYKFPPQLVLVYSDNGKKQINWVKYTIMYLAIVVVSIVLLVLTLTFLA